MEHPRWTTVRVGRVAGIDLRIHVTFLVLVALYAWASSLPGGPGAWAGAAWILAVFACVAVHELGHSLVGARHDAPATEILLIPIGGISKLARLPDDPADELRIAIAGPITSFGLAAAFAALALATGGQLWPPDLIEGAFLSRLAWVNLLLAAFNLLPAFPLDGGRVYRAHLQRSVGLEEATHRAARLGRRLAILLAVVGALSNIWLVLIAGFVWFGSSAEERATTVHARLGPLRVLDVMIEAPLVADGTWTVARFSQVALHHAQRAFPVVFQGTYVGIVDRVALRHADPGQAVVMVADPSAPRLAPDDPAEEGALAVLPTARAHAAVVLDGEAVVGIVRLEDLAELVDEAG